MNLDPPVYYVTISGRCRVKGCPNVYHVDSARTERPKTPMGLRGRRDQYGDLPGGWGYMDTALLRRWKYPVEVPEGLLCPEHRGVWDTLLETVASWESQQRTLRKLSWLQRLNLPRAALPKSPFVEDR